MPRTWRVGKGGQLAEQPSKRLLQGGQARQPRARFVVGPPPPDGAVGLLAWKEGMRGWGFGAFKLEV
jgi:hypothetical protein